MKNLSDFMICDNNEPELLEGVATRPSFVADIVIIR